MDCKYLNATCPKHRKNSFKNHKKGPFQINLRFPPEMPEPLIKKPYLLGLNLRPPNFQKLLHQQKQLLLILKQDENDNE